MEDKKLYIGSIVVIVIILGIIGNRNKNSNIIPVADTFNNEIEIINLEEDLISESTSTTPETYNIIVYISGEVVTPNVYSLSSDSRINDLVMLAGGLTENADINRINLSKKLYDEDHIIIPAIGEELSTYTTNSSSSSESLLVNINTGTLDELKTLPGIGDVTANNIIKYRETNGLFKNIEDIKNVSRIGEVTFSNIKDNITVNGG